MARTSLKTSQLLIIGLGVVILLAAVFYLGRSLNTEEGETSVVQDYAITPTPITVDPVTADDHILGPATADVVIIEYSDFSCPFCQQMHPLLQQVFDAYGGRVAWVYRHFPISSADGTTKSAEASECVAELGGNRLFWNFIDRLFERMPQDGFDFPEEDLAPLAVEIGIDENAFTACLESERHAKTVQGQYESGQRAGVAETPGMFLVRFDQQLYLTGALSFEDLHSAIFSLTGLY